MSNAKFVAVLAFIACISAGYFAWGKHSSGYGPGDELTIPYNSTCYVCARTTYTALKADAFRKNNFVMATYTSCYAVTGDTVEILAIDGDMLLGRIKAYGEQGYDDRCALGEKILFLHDDSYTYIPERGFVADWRSIENNIRNDFEYVAEEAAQETRLKNFLAIGTR